MIALWAWQSALRSASPVTHCQPSGLRKRSSPLLRRCSNPSPQKSKSHARPSSAPRLRHRVLVASSRHAMPPAHHPKRSGLDGARVSVKEQTKSPTRTCRLTCASPQAEPFRRPTTLPLDPPRRKAARACIGFAADLKTLFCAEARGNLRRGNPLKSGVL